MISLDATTKAEYEAQSTAADRAQAILSALADPVSVRIYDETGTLRASGTMQTPWATRNTGALTLGELAGFNVTSGGTPNAGWYLRFESGSRWMRGRFGLAGSGADFTWSLPGFSTGSMANIGTAVVNAADGSVPPSSDSVSVFATIPELAFIEEFADAEEMGVFFAAGINRTAIGDLWWEAPLTSRLKNIYGSNYTPTSVTLETVSGTQPTGMTYNPATGRIEYNGASQAAAVTDWTVRFSYNGAMGTVYSNSFRIRVLRPTVIWGLAAATAYSSKWSGATIARATGTFQAMQSNITTARGDSNPNVVLCLGGTYDSTSGGNLFLGADKKAVYLLGDPTDRPIWANDASFSYDTFDVTTADSLLYLKQLEWKSVGINLGPSAPGRTTRLYISRMYLHTDNPIASFDNFAGSNQEFDGGGTSPPSVITGSKIYHAWNIKGFNVGTDDLHHLFYLHGRPGGEGYFNNLNVRGAENCQVIKSTLPVLDVWNSYLSALQDPENPAIGERSNNLIDQINVSTTRIYNCHMVGAFNPTLPSAQNGTQNGMIFFRARRECYGSDSPAYPDRSWATLTTSMLNNGYMPQPGGYDGSPATFADADFWADAQAGGINSPSNPYLFRHWIDYCKFQWVQETGGNEQPAIRNDGTYPRIFVAPKSVPSVFLTTHPDWFERSVDFVSNCEFYGWTDLSDAMLFSYDDSESSSAGPPAAEYIPVWPQDGGTLLWPRSGADMFPRYILTNITRGSAPPSVLSIAAGALTSGWSDPLDIPDLTVETVRTNPEDTLAYPDTSSNKRTWHWSSKWCWDSVQRRMVAIHSPHIETDNLRAQLLSVYDEADNSFVAYENPIMRTVGHCFDTNAIDVAGRRLYKWTVPKYESGAEGTTVYPYVAPYTYVGSVVPTGQSGMYVQPQLCVVDLDAANFQDGAGLIKEVARPTGDANITAPALDWFPGVGLCMFHKDRVWILNTATDVWSAPYVLSFPDGTSLHNIGHYNPTAGLFIFGGGSYTPNGDYIRTFYKMTSGLVFTRLDDAPIAMSVNNDAGALAKCCATYIPNDVRSVFFHQDGNVYLLNPTAAPGSQWTTVTNGMAGDPNNGSNDERWCCALPDHGAVAVGHFAFAGASIIRLWKP
jgi:hypothetical protein